MKRLGTLLAGVGLIVASGAIDTARADDHRVTLYTPAIRSGSFNCNALNVSHKTLRFFADRAAKKWPLRRSLKLTAGSL